MIIFYICAKFFIFVLNRLHINLKVLLKEIVVPLTKNEQRSFVHFLYFHKVIKSSIR